MVNQSKNIVSCDECGFREPCGGIAEQSPLFGVGCFTKCWVNCRVEKCDLTCPMNPRLFSHRISEIEGNFEISAPWLKVPRIKLLSYVPKIHNGSGREKALPEQVAAIPVRELLSKSGQRVSCRFSDRDQVRQFFRLSPRSEFLITCISVDEDIEMVWQGLRYGSLAKELSMLKAAAIIVPNFSFFTDDVPRTHTLYNRKRIVMAARILSESGCRVILPLYAATPTDWNFWYDILQENPKMKYVAKEFQTGLAQPRAAGRAIEDLAILQNRLGRPLHPVVFAGDRYRAQLKTHFTESTVIDSRPFMATVNRYEVRSESDGTRSEIFSPTEPGEPIDTRLKSNVREYRKPYEV